MISGPGVVSPERGRRSSVPATASRSADRPLPDARRHGNAAEGQQCGLGEEPAHLRQRVPLPSAIVTPIGSQRQAPATPFDDQARHAKRVCAGAAYRRRSRPVRARLGNCLVTTTGHEFAGHRPPVGMFSIAAAATTMAGKGNRKREDGHEGSRSNRPQDTIFQCARTDPVRRISTTIAVTAGLMP